MTQPEQTLNISVILDFNIKVMGRTYSYQGCSDRLFFAKNEHEALLAYYDYGHDEEVDESNFIYEGIRLKPQWQSCPSWAESLECGGEGIRLLECGSFLIPYEENVNQALNDLTEFIKNYLCN